ncbi:MAG: DUF177 domain-containing protein [Candidatus Electrothrix sp. ATG1]|nr:DUF177 domain-containing protein [Candidatus Electrothrix sp. ATG1]MCI5211474.1 DUF177 domain-containing protein [Candidatus Electrothrix sp. ATG2]
MFTARLSDIKMRVQFTDISTAGNHYSISDDNWLAQTDCRKNAPVQAELALTRKSDTRVEVRGNLDAGLLLSCDRCLRDYSFVVKTDFHYLLDVASEESGHVKEIECTRASLDIIQVSDPVVDIPDLLRQQLYLVLPEKKICSRNCKGLCARCGTNLNTGRCSCANEEGSSPFAVLASLKKG